MVLVLFCLYLLSFGLIVINPGIYWDDWTLINSNFSEIIEAFKQSGLSFFGHWHTLLLSVPQSILVYRSFIFLSYFLTGLFLLGILKKLKLTSRQIFLITAIFLLFPINSARVALINSPSALANLLFFFAFWLTTIFVKKKKLFLRLTALLCFYISFFINSIIIFYLVVILYLFYTKKWQLKSLIMSYGDFLALPILYWFIQSKFFKTYGLYEGYHNIGFKSLVKSGLRTFESFNTSFTEVIRQSFVETNLLFVGIGAIIIFYFLYKSYKEVKKKAAYNTIYFLLGIILFYLAAFPYNVAGSGLLLSDWNSRNQLLLPLGASFILYFGMEIILNFLKLKPVIGYIFFSLLISFFVFKNFQYNLIYFADWFKQLSLIENFKNNKVIQSNASFIIKDNCQMLNANNREYRFYEYSGLFSFAFNDQKRFASLEEHFASKGPIVNYSDFFNSRYKLKDFMLVEPNIVISINCPGLILLKTNFHKVIYSKYFNKPEFSNYISRLVSLDISQTHVNEK